MAICIAFQGERGAYGEVAVKQFVKDALPIPSSSFEAVFEAVQKNEVALGAVPVENSYAGSINETYDLLAVSDLKVIGETNVWVKHCLMALPGQSLKDIKTVYSHPQALAQCASFLKSLGVECIAVYDTAGSAKMILEKNLKGSAAVASETAAVLYGLEILKKEIQSSTMNFTKFYLISRQDEVLGDDFSQDNYKTALVLAAPDAPGSLYHCLGALAEKNINLKKLESRPRRDVPWQYLFYIDCEGHIKQEPLKSALKELELRAAWYKVLGSFSEKGPST